MILDMRSIYKDYMQGKEAVPVLKNIDFQVDENEYVAIMGPSGSGKSTLMNIIGCLDKQTFGLEDRIEFKPTQLSGGQKQRVAIARAIVNKPRLLLADEPTGALDTKSGEQIMELFEGLNSEGVTIVMITHEREIADYAKRIMLIRDGEISPDNGGETA